MADHACLPPASTDAPPGPLDEVLGLLREIRAAHKAPTSLAVSAAEAAALCGVAERTWWQWHSAERVPPPVDLPGRRRVWLRAQIEEWLQLSGPDRATYQRLCRRGGAR